MKTFRQSDHGIKGDSIANSKCSWKSESWQISVRIYFGESRNVITNRRTRLQANFWLVCVLFPAVLARLTRICSTRLTSRFLLRSVSQLSMQTLCQSRLSNEKDMVSWPPINNKHFKLTPDQALVLSAHIHTHIQTRKHGRVIIFALKKFRRAHFHCFFSSLFSFFFWWRYKSERWKAYLMFMVVLGWTAFTVQRQY